MKMRLDQALVDRGLCESRERARRAVLAGQVRVNDQVARKPSDSVKASDNIALATPEKFVSRGGHKLEHALAHFGMDLAGFIVIDLGASTGGFTDCALQHGASKVYAVDVGHGQLAWKLRQDPRVVVMEKTNARDLTVASFGTGFLRVDVVVVDCSFISLNKIIPAAVALLKPSGKIVALIKPQFEAGRAAVKKGVVRDPGIHATVCEEITGLVATLGWTVLGVIPSPIAGGDGNREFLIGAARD